MCLSYNWRQNVTSETNLKEFLKQEFDCQWWVSNSQPLDYKPSALAIEPQELKSYCWEGVEFIQLVYCIIIYLSFLNCDWLLIREVQWFYWTQELLVPVEKFTVRMPMVSLELANGDGVNGESQPGVASSRLTTGILTVNFSTGTRSSCVQ